MGDGHPRERKWEGEHRRMLIPIQGKARNPVGLELNRGEGGEGGRGQGVGVLAARTGEEGVTGFYACSK